MTDHRLPMDKFHRFHPSILREYDIRGVVGQTVGAQDAIALGQGFALILRAEIAAGRIALAAGAKPAVAVGYDGRLSSPMLEAALVEGLATGGVDVVRIGLCSTPMLYFAEASMEDVQGGIQVTGSHNPADHNGFKIVLDGRPFFGADLLRLGAMAAGDLVPDVIMGGKGVDTVDRRGICHQREIAEIYIERLLDGFAELDEGRLAAMRVGWDAGNGTAGPIIEALAQRLRGEHFLLYTEIDGHFPNHHPDPTVAENLADLRNLVASNHLDFGVAFDGDADRIGLVDGKGRIIWGDQILMLLAEDLLQRQPGATILADVKASQALFDRVAELGGVPVMCETGHSLVKSRMKEIGAPLGGEMTGHIFFAENWYGFDDAIRAALQLIAIVARTGRSITDWCDGLPQYFATPELRFAVSEDQRVAVVDAVAARLAGQGRDVCTIDGLRVTGVDGWWLLRRSNTQAMLTARAESRTEAGLARLLADLDAHLAACGIVRPH